MSWPVFFAGLGLAAFGIVLLRIAINALAAAEQAAEQHEHMSGDWQ